ncbi:DUF202 domain-containing protein [Thermasporomyces composti]|nr:DUF202 domain-containing protein [Thermasporomyces composti]
MDGDGMLHERADQLERTALAWRRTLLALAINGALLVRVSGLTGTWALVAGVLLVAVTVPAWVVTSRTYRRLRGGPAVALLARGRFTVCAVVLVVVVGVCDLLAVLTHR